MNITLETLMAPRLRWARRGAAIVPGLLAIILLISLAMPPIGNAAPKAVFILLFTLIALASIVFSFYTMLTMDERAALKEGRTRARRGPGAANAQQRTPAQPAKRPVPAGRSAARGRR